MHGRIDLMGLKGLFNPLSIRKVPFYKEDILYSFSMAGLEIIENDGPVALTEKFLYDVASNVSGSTCNKDC